MVIIGSIAAFDPGDLGARLLKIVVPLVFGSLLATFAGTAVGSLLGLNPSRSLSGLRMRSSIHLGGPTST
jgi:Na+/citrate or Na+/malate symporter